MREIDTWHLAPGSRGSQKKEEMDKANQKRARGGIAKEMTKKKRKTRVRGPSPLARALPSLPYHTHF